MIFCHIFRDTTIETRVQNKSPMMTFPQRSRTDTERRRASRAVRVPRASGTKIRKHASARAPRRRARRARASSAVAPAAGAPFPKRGRKRKCPHARRGPTKASARAAPQSARRFSVVAARSTRSLRSWSLQAPRFDHRGGVTAGEVQGGAVGSGMRRCGTLAGRSAEDADAGAVVAGMLSSARSTEARKCRVTLKEAIAPLWPPSTSRTTPRPPPWIPSAVPSASSRRGTTTTSSRIGRGAGKSEGRRRRLPAPSKT